MVRASALASARPCFTASAKSVWVAIQFWMVRRVTPQESPNTSLVAPSTTGKLAYSGL